jgi:hypothetical protein
MLVRLVGAILIAAVAAVNYGCSTLADARKARGTGEARIYDVPPDAVWGALPAVIQEVGLEYVGENRQEGYTLAQRGITPLSYGEHVAIFVDPARPGSKTRVEVVSKKAMATNVLVPNWESEILDKLGQKLATAGAAPTVARLEDVDALPLNERGKQGYREWLTKNYPRAFVIAENGAWQSAWGNCTKNPDEPCDPAQRALANCQKRNYKKCKLYAVDNRVVWVPE